MKFAPTPEQARAEELFASGQSLRIEALAGTGKTTTLEHLVSSGRARGKCLYTSFGRKVIDDAKRRFPSTCRVATNHGLAWGIGRTYHEQGRLRGRLSTADLVQRMGWTDATFSPFAPLASGAFAVIETINRFCQTADQAIDIGHSAQSASRQLRGRASQNIGPYAALLADTAAEVWELMVAPTDRIAVSHDVYLKKWALGRPRLNYASVLLDEAQDANGVIVGVLQDQPHAQLVIVGDRRQAIYGWRGAVDAMDQFDIQNHCALTQSWRFGPPIADAANKVLVNQCGSLLELRGDPSRPGFVGRIEQPHCILARTNASLVAELFLTEQAKLPLRVGVVGGVDDLIKLVDGADRLHAGLPAFHPELDEFSEWGQVQDAVEHEAYQHLRVLVDLVDTYGTDALRVVLEKVRGNEAQPARCDRLLSTAHKAKGSEYDSVLLLDDFAVMGPPDAPDLFGWKPEDGNLLYVAVTRARQGLDPTHCAAAMETLGSLAPQAQANASTSTSTSTPMAGTAP